LNYSFSFKRTPFNSDYEPDKNSRLTTNFANLSKNPLGRKRRIEGVLQEMEKQLNALFGIDDTLTITIEIISAEIKFEGDGCDWFPLFEFLDVSITNKKTGEIFEGPFGCNFSSFIRDYDFKYILPDLLKTTSSADLSDFGNLHSLFFNLCSKHLIETAKIQKPIIVAISIGNGKEYLRNNICHPILGYQYIAKDEESITSKYFSKMGFSPNYFLPNVCSAPLAIYCKDDSLLKQSDLTLAALIAVMNVFQQIYRPEIYCSSSPAGSIYMSNLDNKNFNYHAFTYDRAERDQVLSINQALFVKENFLDKYAESINELVQQKSQ
jgi:hypothetical protein